MNLPSLLEIGLPNFIPSTFFKPKDSFLKWLTKFTENKIVFDVGCGNGNFLKRMHKLKIKAIGIDPIYIAFLHPDQELRNCILPMFAQECKILQNIKNSIILFCRPCHDGFVYETIKKIHKNNIIFYISKTINVNIDIPGLNYKIINVPGLQEEKLYQVL